MTRACVWNEWQAGLDSFTRFTGPPGCVLLHASWAPCIVLASTAGSSLRAAFFPQEDAVRRRFGCARGDGGNGALNENDLNGQHVQADAAYMQQKHASGCPAFWPQNPAHPATLPHHDIQQLRTPMYFENSTPHLVIPALSSQCAVPQPNQVRRCRLTHATWSQHH